MILIAPDKFKGTLSAWEAAGIIAEMMHPLFCLKAPMADGGEGTARAVAAQNPQDWEQHDCYYVNRKQRIAAIDSSAVVGITDERKRNLLRASSIDLGLKVREIIKGGCEKVLIGIGGTGICDGGVGFLQGLGLDHYMTYRDKIIGLSDVKCPLISTNGGVDALTFAPQKGATSDQMPLLREKLEEVKKKYGHGRESAYDGAGGGLGFAIATAIGATCLPGAKFVLDNYNINWDLIEYVVTGEGCIDSQTAAGKVVDTVVQEAAKHGIPSVAIGGTIKKKSAATIDIAADKYLADEQLNHEVAAARLRHAAVEAREWIAKTIN